MLLHWGIAGSWSTFNQTVAATSLSSMLPLIPWALHYATMKSGRLPADVKLSVRLIWAHFRLIIVEPTKRPVKGETLPGAFTITDNGARLNNATTCLLQCQSPFSNHWRPAIKNRISSRKGHTSKVREIEHGSFTPIVMSVTGGLGKADTGGLPHLSLPSKTVALWPLSFSLLCSAVQSISQVQSISEYRTRHSTA